MSATGAHPSTMSTPTGQAPVESPKGVRRAEFHWAGTDISRRFTLRTPQSKRVSSLRETDFNRG